MAELYKMQGATVADKIRGWVFILKSIWHDSEEVLQIIIMHWYFFHLGILNGYGNSALGRFWL